MGCTVEALDDMQARSIGALAARAGVSDIVDVCVIEGAFARRDLVVTSNPDDLKAIAASNSKRLEVERP